MTKANQRKEKILRMFNEWRTPPYEIHEKTGFSIKEIYHIVNQAEVARAKRKREAYNAQS